MTLSTAPTAPVESGTRQVRPLRVVLFHGRDDRARVSAIRVARAAAAEIRDIVGASDPRSFADLAQSLRDASADVVIASAASPGDAEAIRDSFEPLRYGCAAARPAPRVIALCDARAAERMAPAVRPFALEIFAEAPRAVTALRALRRALGTESTLRDEVLDDAARALAARTGSDALLVDVSEGSTSCVFARADGSVDAVHSTPLGLGEAADRVVARSGVDRVRRWMPWAIDNPALLERIYNRARWAGAVPTSTVALALEMALAREAIALALGDAAEAGVEIARMRAAPSVLVTGRAAAFPRASQTLLTLVDGLEPTRVTTVWREGDDTRPERVALVASVAPRGTATVRLVSAAGRRQERVARGEVRLAAVRGDVDVAGAVRGTGNAGALGVFIDARGRPLALPHRDAERMPALGRWYGAVGAFGEP